MAKDSYQNDQMAKNKIWLIANISVYLHCLKVLMVD